jgi:hypothetical protein
MKQITRNVFVTVILALCLAAAGSALAQSSASYEITKSAMSGGGTTSTSASYELTGTLGQPSPVDVSDSASYSLGSGFWGATVRMFTVAIESISFSIAEGVSVAWQSIAGVSYTVYFTDDLMDVWLALSSFTGTGSLMEWLDDGGETGSNPNDTRIGKRYYRIGTGQ